MNRNSWIPGIKNGCYNHSVSYSYLTAIKRLKPFRWIDALNKVSKVISVSQFLADKLFEFGVPANKVIVLPNAVETGFASGKGKYVLYLGNIIYEKGVELVCLIAAKLPYIKFVIAGEGADKKYLISKYSELKNLEFRGYLTGPAKENILQHAYFLYYPSLCQETFGLSILEAYSHGKPVLTTGFGSTGNLVIDNKTGIINKNTSLESQASSINTLWQQLKAGNSYKENCLEFVKEYACEKHLDKLIQCYTEIL